MRKFSLILTLLLSVNAFSKNVVMVVPIEDYQSFSDSVLIYTEKVIGERYFVNMNEMLSSDTISSLGIAVEDQLQPIILWNTLYKDIANFFLKIVLVIFSLIIAYEGLNSVNNSESEGPLYVIASIGFSLILLILSVLAFA